MLRKLSLALVLLSLASCEYNREVEMPTVVSTRMSETDVLTVYINGVVQDVELDNETPVHQYRPKVLVRYNRSLTAPRIYYAQVHVSVYSRELARMSRTKSRSTRNDRVVEFEFRPSDFR